MKQNPILKTLVIVGSVITVGFGVWHFPLPSVYSWFDFVTDESGELVAAIRAINFFFSLSLVMFGVQTIVLAARRWGDRFVTSVSLVGMSILWTARVVLQIIYPQGTEIGISGVMLGIFVFTALCFIAPAVLRSSARGPAASGRVTLTRS